MKTIAIINLKGGVGKSVTTCNLACEIVAAHPSQRVLVMDLDKQANTTRFFERFSYNHKSAADLLCEKGMTIADVMQTTPRAGINLVPANMNLLRANKMVLMDCTRRQQDRIKRALAAAKDDYDLCLIDCPPDLDMAVINALVAADYIIIPVDCDEWALDGLAQILEQVEELKEEENPRLEVLGVLCTKYRLTRYASDTIKALRDTGVPLFDNVIRYTVAVAEAKAKHLSAREHKRQCGAALDYRALAADICKKLSIVDTAGGNDGTAK